VSFAQWFFILLIFVPLAIVYLLTIWNIFTRPEMAGWMRALWLVIVVVFPFLGTIVYLIVHGGSFGAQRGLERRATDIGTGRAPF
jgi:hypothetical protein